MERSLPQKMKLPIATPMIFLQHCLRINERTPKTLFGVFFKNKLCVLYGKSYIFQRPTHEGKSEKSRIENTSVGFLIRNKTVLDICIHKENHVSFFNFNVAFNENLVTKCVCY